MRVLSMHKVLGRDDQSQGGADLGRVGVPKAAVTKDTTLWVFHVRAPTNSNLTHA